VNNDSDPPRLVKRITIRLDTDSKEERRRRSWVMVVSM
jgi:hypothetical protein